MENDREKLTIGDIDIPFTKLMGLAWKWQQAQILVWSAVFIPLFFVIGVLSGSE